MLSGMRAKFGPIVMGGILAFIAFVFIFSGVFTPSPTRGLHEGSVAGTVNGDPISLGEFNRAYNQRLEYFKAMSGGKMSDEQIKAFRIKDGVFNDLVNRKLMEQQAVKTGRVVSDEEVRERIREIPAFQKDGKFDAGTYQGVLAANNYTPGGFERLMRQDLNAQQWGKFFRDRVKVSDEEVKQEFLITRDKRNIKYVLLTPEAGRKAVAISEEELKKALADAGTVNIAKAQYEQKKDTEYKGKGFEAVKEQIVRENLAIGKADEVRKANEKIAQKVADLLSADKQSDAKVNQLLKPYGVEVKSTGLVARTSNMLPGIGEAKEVLSDAFAPKSPIDPKDGGKAKIYNPPTGVLVAVVSDAQEPNLANLAADREQIVNQLIARKERELYDTWIKKVISKADIDRNEEVLSDESER